MRTVARTLTILLLAGWLAVPSAAQDTPGEPDPPPPDVVDCTPPPLDDKDDFFQVNPTIRQQFYDYMSKSVAPPVSPKLNGPDVSESDRLIFRGRFRLFITDLLNINTQLVTTTREVMYLRGSDPHRYKDYPVRDIFRDIDKHSGELADRLVLLLPDNLDDSFDRKEVRRRYGDMVHKGQQNAMITLLLHKVSAFERRLCNLLFPRVYTVSIDELAVHSSPLTDIQDIRELARALQRVFPKKGFPAGFHAD
jgi:hypothetical protein